MRRICLCVCVVCCLATVGLRRYFVDLRVGSKQRTATCTWLCGKTTSWWDAVLHLPATTTCWSLELFSCSQPCRPTVDVSLLTSPVLLPPPTQPVQPPQPCQCNVWTASVAVFCLWLASWLSGLNLSLPCALSVVDRWPPCEWTVRYGPASVANSASHPSGVGNPCNYVDYGVDAIKMADCG